jgi:fused signal recognition particle receptor
VDPLIIIGILVLVVIATVTVILVKSKNKVPSATKVSKSIVGDDKVLNQLLSADISQELATGIRQEFGKTKNLDQALSKFFSEKSRSLMHPEIATPVARNDGRGPSGTPNTVPTVIMFVGVNGVGKTTSIAKFATKFKGDGKSVILAATDTFRAAGATQLNTWADKLGVSVVVGESNQDPASVAYKAVDQALEQGIDIVLIDTSGRLQNNTNLMEELAKIKRVIEKTAQVSEVLLVVDANHGKNALDQAEQFGKTIDITGVILTKFDGSSKAGTVLEIESKFDIPVKFVGVGEKETDLKEFVPELLLNKI